jgi:hypothetical protein
MSLPQEHAELLQQQARADALVGEIVEKRRLMVDCDRRRQLLTEALAQFRPAKAGKAANNLQDARRTKAWMSTGTFFVKLPQTSIKASIERERGDLDATIGGVRDEIKTLIKQLSSVAPDAVAGMDPHELDLVLRTS